MQIKNKLREEEIVEDIFQTFQLINSATSALVAEESED